MAKEGFIVHPFETNDRKYHASYGKNINKTVRGFRTLSQAKAYIAKHGYNRAMYDSPSGVKTVKTSASVSRPKRRIVRRSNNLFGNSNFMRIRL